MLESESLPEDPELPDERPLPEDDPEGNSEPPVDELDTPKCWLTWSRQLAWEICDQLPWLNFGAWSSLLSLTWSVKLGCDSPPTPVADMADEEGCNNCQGTGINWPLDELELLIEPRDPLEPDPELCEEPLEPAPELLPEEDPLAPMLLRLLPLREMTAKSIFPDVELRMMSSISPIWEPELLLTSAPMTLLARKACWLERPVALMDWLLLLEMPPLERSCEEPLDDDWSCEELPED